MKATSYLVLLFPLAVTVDMLPVSVFANISRFVILVSLLGGFAALPGSLSRTELRWLLLLSLLIVSEAASTALSTDLPTSAIDLAKQVYLATVAVVFSFSCRQLATRRVLIAGMLLPAAFSTGLILWCAWKYRGLHVEQMKAAADAAQIQLNAIAGMASMALLLISTFLRSWTTRAGWYLFAFIVLWLSGARTTLASFVLALTMVASMRYLGPRNTRIIGVLAAMLVGLVVTLSWTGTVHSPVSEAEAAKFTSGRVYLWDIAWKSFLERPISGWGAGTWKAQLNAYASLIPVYYRKNTLKLQSGAYHNAYLDYLAERGVFVTLIALALLWFLIRKAWYLFSIRYQLTGFDRRVAEVAPTLMLLIVFRGLAEVSGLLAYANGVDDYLAFIFAGLIVAVATAAESAEIVSLPQVVSGRAESIVPYGARAL